MTHQISALVSDEAYENYISITRGQRSKWLDKCMRKAPDLMQDLHYEKWDKFNIEYDLYCNGIKLMRDYVEGGKVNYHYITVEDWKDQLKQEYNFDDVEVEYKIRDYWDMRRSKILV